MLRVLAVAMGVAQILAMALTLMLLWALYYGENSPGVDPSPLDDSGSNGAPAEACQLGCYHHKSAVTATSRRTEFQLDV